MHRAREESDVHEDEDTINKLATSRQNQVPNPRDVTGMRRCFPQANRIVCRPCPTGNAVCVILFCMSRCLPVTQEMRTMTCMIPRDSCIGKDARYIYEYSWNDHDR